MARYIGPVCRMCRREGIKLFLKGERCYTDKCAIERRSYPPGQHGQGRGKKATEYSVQLREKQKLRRIYGMLEMPFRRFFALAERQRGVTGENLVTLLERRLDNMVYRMGFSTSRSEARQLVRHGHFLVNQRRVTIPSYLVGPGDAVQVKRRAAKWRASRNRWNWRNAGACRSGWKWTRRASLEKCAPCRHGPRYHCR